jgi:hypothetical protein
VQLLKSRFPNLPPTFVDVVKVQYNEVSSASHITSRAISVGRNGFKFAILKFFPNLVQDVGHAIVEAYSRVLVGVSFSILSRVAEVMLEDDLIKKPNTPMATLKFDLSSDVYLAGITETPPGHIRRSLMDQISMVDGRFDAIVKKKGAKQLVWLMRGGGVVVQGPRAGYTSYIYLTSTSALRFGGELNSVVTAALAESC